MRALVAHPTRPVLISGAFEGDRALHVWDADTGRLMRRLSGHRENINGLALDREGRRVASCSFDLSVRVWDVESGECLRTFVGHREPVNAVIWNQTGVLVASASNDKSVRVWSPETGELVRSIDAHTMAVNALAAHPSDELFASGSSDNSVRVWRWSSGERVRTFTGHGDFVSALAASDAFVVSASADRTVRVWSWGADACVRVLRAFSKLLRFNSLAWRGSTLLTLVGDGKVHVWDTASADANEWRLMGHVTSKALRGVALLADGRIACGGRTDERVLSVWREE